MFFNKYKKNEKAVTSFKDGRGLIYIQLFILNLVLDLNNNSKIN